LTVVLKGQEVAGEPDRNLELGRFAELAALAAGSGLGLYIEPPTPGSPERHESDWVVGVLGESEGEPLGFAPVLADTIELSFLPLETYIRAGLTGGVDSESRTQPGATEKAFAVGLEPFADLVARAAEHGCGLWHEPPWPASRRTAGHWVIGLLGEEASGPLALGPSFRNAVISSFPSFDHYARTGRLQAIWISGDGSSYRRVDESS
jgi:hypothetical protein